MMQRTFTLLATALLLPLPASPDAFAGGEGIVTRRYDIGPIVAALADRPAPPIRFGELPLGRWQKEPRRDPLPLVIGEETSWRVPNPPVDAELLRELVGRELARLGVAEEEFLDELRIEGSTLTVSAPAGAQEGLRRFLGDLEAFARRRIRVECLSVPPALLDALAPSWRSWGPVLPVDTFDRAVLDPRARLLTLIVRPGQRIFGGTKEILRLLCDEDINQTGVAPVKIPVVEDRGGGDLVEIQTFIAPDGKAILLEVIATAVAVRAEKTSIGREWSDLELPIAEGARIRTAAALAPGEAIVLASLEGRTARAILLRATLLPPARAGEPVPEAAEEVFRVYDISAIIRARRRRAEPEPAIGVEREGMPFAFGAEKEEDEERDDPRDALEASIRKLLGEETLEEGRAELERGNGCIFFSGPRSFREKLEAFLASKASGRTASLSVDLELLDVPRSILGRLAGEAEGALALKPGWRKILEPVEGIGRRSYRIALVPGETHSLRDAAVRSIVAGRTDVSGGTGYRIQIASDPEVETWGEGIDLSVRVDLAEDPGEVLLRVKGIEAANLELRPAIARSTVADAEGTGGSSEGVPPHAPEGASGRKRISEMRLELPRQMVSEWNLELDVPVDRDLLLETRAEKGERARLLIGRVLRPAGLREPR